MGKEACEKKRNLYVCRACRTQYDDTVSYCTCFVCSLLWYFTYYCMTKKTKKTIYTRSEEQKVLRFVCFFCRCFSLPLFSSFVLFCFWDTTLFFSFTMPRRHRVGHDRHGIHAVYKKQQYRCVGREDLLCPLPYIKGGVVPSTMTSYCIGRLLPLTHTLLRAIAVHTAVAPLAWCYP